MSRGTPRTTNSLEMVDVSGHSLMLWAPTTFVSVELGVLPFDMCITFGETHSTDQLCEDPEDASGGRKVTR